MPYTGKRAKRKTAFSLSVQYASRAADIPARWRFRRWVDASLRKPAVITLRVVDEDEGRILNRDYRGKDYATNVLTFVYGEEQGKLLGDIVLCAPVVAKESAQQGKPLLEHYAHLTVHGVLHLQGFDHETDADARAMEGEEVEILGKLGFNDPYRSEQS